MISMYLMGWWVTLGLLVSVTLVYSFVKFRSPPANSSEFGLSEISGTEDPVATKLDLARAYIDMGDLAGAQNILQGIALQGTEQQQAEVQKLLAECAK